MIISSDWHFTDRKRDMYRWDVFPFLIDLLEKTDSEELFVLGDITDAKDNHSSFLVNSIVDNFRKIPVPVTIIAGNHDYIDSACPFFRFLNFDDIKFIVEPEIVETTRGRILCLPNSKNPKQEWDKIDLDQNLDAIFCHQMFTGAKSSNGFALEGGLTPKYFSNRAIQVP